MSTTKKAQVAIFIVIALVIVGSIVSYLILRERATKEKTYPELEPVFDYYQSCIEQETKNAIELVGAQGGRIDIGSYAPGSDYAPFSSHLNFLGIPVKYWYYASANGLIHEQVPTLAEMEKDIENYVENNLKNCDFDYFYKQGFAIRKQTPSVKVQIEDTKVNVQVNSEISVTKDDKSAKKPAYNVEVGSKLGKFYQIAKKIYDKEKQEAFLEQYARDVLYNYAPVDGVELQCGPKVWSTRNVISELKNGLEQNFMAIKFQGNYYKLANEKNKYFVVDSEVDEAVNVIYSQQWPTKIEITGDSVDDELMLADSVGTQAGLGIMGFCYVPYHFVYDIKFPAMIQIYNNMELFQFPVVVLIDKNMPRNANLVSGAEGGEEDFDLCAFKNQEVEISLYDVNLDNVDGNVSYECFDQRCRLGETRGGKLRAIAPACVNGYLNVRADGYAEKSQLFSTNKEKFADVILEREHEINAILTVDGKNSKENAVISFTRDDGKTFSMVIPEMNSIKLSEGNYEIKVYVYGNSSVTIPASTKYQCVDVPREGLLGFLGGKQEKCFDITIPATKIEYALVGGGKVNSYILESELEKGKLRVEVDSLPKPNSLDALQKNFELFDSKIVRLDFYER